MTEPSKHKLVLRKSLLAELISQGTISFSCNSFGPCQILDRCISSYHGIFRQFPYLQAYSQFLSLPLGGLWPFSPLSICGTDGGGQESSGRILQQSNSYKEVSLGEERSGEKLFKDTPLQLTYYRYKFLKTLYLPESRNKDSILKSLWFLSSQVWVHLRIDSQQYQ